MGSSEKSQCHDRCRELRGQINYLKNKQESILALLDPPYVAKPLSDREMLDSTCKGLFAEMHGLLFVQNVIRELLKSVQTHELEEPPEKFLPLVTSTPGENSQSVSQSTGEKLVNVESEVNFRSKSSLYDFEAGQRWSFKSCNKTSLMSVDNEETEDQLQTENDDDN